MSERTLAALAVGAVLSCPIPVQAQNQDTLPLAKVRLYETGVGYFERSGPLPAGGARLPVPVGHLDDALKTLVILDADGRSTVSGISFPSSVSRELGRALAGLPAGEDTPLSLPRLIESLEGEAVEVRSSGGILRGRIVDLVDAEASGVERCVPGTAGPEQPCTLRQEPTLVLLGENGELRRLVVADVDGVRPLDPAARGRFAAALDAVGDGGARARRWLEVAAAGGRAITLGYVAEAPVWRSTYRLVIAGEGPAGLQGWALVHNDTDEAWRRVRLELVNGQPDSFLFPLAAPRYAWRELVPPSQELSTVPQLLDRTVDGMLWGDQIGEAFGAGGPGLSGIGAGGGGHGEGIGLGMIGTAAGGAAASDLVTVGSLASLAPAEGVEAGAIFTYAVGTPLDLRPRSSAIVPFLSGSLEAERIAWFDEAGAAARSAVHLTNTTGQTLPAGTLAVFADGGFAGEALLSRTKPREQRILGFGVDLDVELTEVDRDERREPRAFARGEGPVELLEHYYSRLELRYSLVNRSGSSRLVVLDLDYQDNARVTGADRLGFDTERGQAYAVFGVGPHATLERTLVVERGLVEKHSIFDCSAEWLDEMARDERIRAGQRAVLAELFRLRTELTAARARAEEAGERAEQREADLERVHESLTALSKARGRLARRLGARLERIDAELTALEREQRDAEKTAERLHRELIAALWTLRPSRGTAR